MPPKSKYGVRGNYTGVASEHPLYFRWMNMLRRCYEPSFHGYNAYGGRGVTVEPYLQNFANYVDFVSSLPNYNHLIRDPLHWQIDKDASGGNVYSRDTLQIIPAELNLAIENSAKRVPVYRVVDGKIERFESLCAAERETGIHRGNIARSARTGYKAGGYQWWYGYG